MLGQHDGAVPVRGHKYPVGTFAAARHITLRLKQPDRLGQRPCVVRMEVGESGQQLALFAYA
jgi:hypothetical protein